MEETTAFAIGRAVATRFLACLELDPLPLRVGEPFTGEGIAVVTELWLAVWPQVGDQKVAVVETAEPK